MSKRYYFTSLRRTIRCLFDRRDIQESSYPGNVSLFLMFLLNFPSPDQGFPLQRMDVTYY